MWRGKVIGATIGVFAGGPIGALLGAALGHWFDQEAERDEAVASDVTPEQLQNIFFRTAFQTMGCIAKADGRVSEDDIRAARAMMTELQLDDSQVQLAIECFTAGKAPDFDLEGALRRLNGLCKGRRDLKRMFLQMQLRTALRAGSLHQPARRVLAQVCDALHLSAFELVQLEALLRIQAAAAQAHTDDALSAAYEVLGVAAQASDAEVKRAYRRLMNQHHPDKLLAKGMPKSMLGMAEEKTRQIRAAYERVCAARGMK
jgi:DnaJ like chaperone protein